MGNYSKWFADISSPHGAKHSFAAKSSSSPRGDPGGLTGLCAGSTVC